MKYFDHDCEAYKDDKIMLLRRECGGAAVDAYWTLLELIYREETDLKPKQNPSVFASVSIFLMCEQSDLETWVEAMKKYGLLTEDEDSSLMSPRAAANIEGYKERQSRNYKNGSKGGRPRKTPAPADAKTQPKPTENPTETDPKPTQNPKRESGIEKEKEKEKEKEREVRPPFDEATGADEERFAQFGKDALDAFNAATGSSLQVIDGKTWCCLRRIFDAGRTLEDIALVCRDKYDEWKVKPKTRAWIRPSTFFGDKFEEYLMVAQRNKTEEAGLDEYA